MKPERANSKGISNNSTQRKTTLKWGSNGELSSLDMTRILDKLSQPELTQCDLTCELEESEWFDYIND